MIFSLQEGPESFHDKIKQKKSLFQKNTLFWSTSRDLSKLGNFSIFRKQSIFGLLELRSGKIVNLKILKNGGGVISTSHIDTGSGVYISELPLPIIPPGVPKGTRTNINHHASFFCSNQLSFLKL